MRVPSGDHRALEPFVRNRCFVPSAFIIHSADSNRSFILSTQRRVKMICAPSGEMRGSSTVSQSRYMSRLSFLLCACAPAVTSAKTKANNTRENALRFMLHPSLRFEKNQGNRDLSACLERAEQPQHASPHAAPNAAERLRERKGLHLRQIRIGHGHHH